MVARGRGSGVPVETPLGALTDYRDGKCWRSRNFRDDPAGLAALDPEFEFHPDPEAYWVGVDRTYRGAEGIGEYMRLPDEVFEDYHPEIEDLLDAGDKVVTLAIERGRGRGSGAEVQEPNGTRLDNVGRQGDPARPLPRPGARISRHHPGFSPSALLSSR
jgi:hypothetical protein